MEKLRVIYSKSKEAVYLSHLDTLKVFCEALSRANIPVEFSKGFNQDQRLLLHIRFLLE